MCEAKGSVLALDHVRGDCRIECLDRNAGPLEFPTSPVLAGRTLCTTSSDGNRRDKSPSTAGEIGGTASTAPKGKISCIDQRISTPGFSLPIR